VNCGDSLKDFQSLGAGPFRTFWPVKIEAAPDYPTDEPIDLAWRDACHLLFIGYRDTLRGIWYGIKGSGSLQVPIFLMGTTDRHENARKIALEYPPPHDDLPPLAVAWHEILKAFPGARRRDLQTIGANWKSGEFCLLSQNDFQQAFYLLFRQSWRARVCPRCRTFFIARKPKQIFCGTVCSAGSRLASKRKWWKLVGTKRRVRQKESMRSRRGGRNR